MGQEVVSADNAFAWDGGRGRRRGPVGDSEKPSAESDGGIETGSSEVAILWGVWQSRR